MLGPVMTLVNGPTIADAIMDGNNAITRLVQTEKDDRKIVEDIFMRLLCRPPIASEMAAGLKALEANYNEEERNKAVAALAAYQQQLDAKQETWEASQGPTTWTDLLPTEMNSNFGATLTALPDQAILVDGTDGKGAYTVKASTDLQAITGVRVEALTDPKLPKQGPGRSPNGNFVLSEFKVTVTSVTDPSKSTSVTLQNGTADFNQNGFTAANATDNKPGTGWAIQPQTGRNHAATFETGQDVGFPGGTLLTFTLDQQYPDGRHTLGKFRLAVTTSRRPLSAVGPPANITAALATPRDQRTAEQKAELATLFRQQDDEWQRLNSAAAAASKPQDKRLSGAQDLTWALINGPAFLFNR